MQHHRNNELSCCTLLSMCWLCRCCFCFCVHMLFVFFMLQSFGFTLFVLFVHAKRCFYIVLCVFVDARIRLCIRLVFDAATKKLVTVFIRSATETTTEQQQHKCMTFLIRLVIETTTQQQQGNSSLSSQEL